MDDYSIIYKFRNFTNPNHRNLLIKNELFLANSRSFNDPFDCKIPLNLELLNTDSKRLAYAERIYNRNKSNIIKSKTQQKIEIKNFGTFLKEKPEIFQEHINKITF